MEEDVRRLAPPWFARKPWAFDALRPVVFAMSLAPVLVLLAYGCGVVVGGAWAALWAALWLRSKQRPPSRGDFSRALTVGTTVLLVVFQISVRLPSWGVAGALILGTIYGVLQSVFVRCCADLAVDRWCDEAEARTGAERLEEARVSLAQAGVLHALALWVADERLCPWFLAGALACLAGAVWWGAESVRLQRWVARLDEVHPGGEVTHGAVALRCDDAAPYRAASMRPPIAPRSVRSRVAPWMLGAGLLAGPLGAIWTHDYDLDTRALRIEPTSRGRTFVIDRPPPDAVGRRIPRRHPVARLGQYSIPGADLWMNCKEFQCRGASVVVDRDDGHIVEVPELLRRVRSWPLHRQAQLRLQLLARGARGATHEFQARPCGDLVEIRVGDASYAMHRVSGAWAWLSLPAHDACRGAEEARAQLE